MTTDTRLNPERSPVQVGDVDWAAFASQRRVDQEAQLRRLYSDVATLPEAIRVARLRAMMGTTYTLPDEVFRAMIESRLRAWLQLAEEAAARVVRSYDAVLREVSAGDAMRRVAVVPTLMRDFGEEQRRPRRLNPTERAASR